MKKARRGLQRGISAASRLRRPSAVPAEPHAPNSPETPLVNGAWIWCPLRSAWLVLKPEERVRQTFVLQLRARYGYTFEQMDQERKTKHGRRSPKADIVVWDSPAAKIDGRAPIIAVECKSDTLTIDPEDYEQGDSYARAIGDPCEFLVMVNQKEKRVARIVRGLPGSREEIEDIPHFQDLGDAKRMEAIRRATKAFSREEFRALLFDCHCILRDNHKMDPGRAFDEISKILFIKMHVERTGDLEKFTTAYLDQYARIRRRNVEDVMHDLFEDTKEHYKADDLFGVDDRLIISFQTFRRIVEKLQRFNLGATSDDIKGIAFERFLGQTFRGELGQFFTPRRIVEFMVQVLDPEEGQLICDPASGSGGFLIKCFEYVRGKIEAEVHASKLDARRKIEQRGLSDEEAASQVNEEFARLNAEIDVTSIGSRLWTIAHKCVYGVDAEPRAARTSKMNMIMHGDGHGGIHHHDGFVDVNGIFDRRFDIILTNPPFGSTVGEDQKIGGTAETRVAISTELRRQYEAEYGEPYRASHARLVQAERNHASILSLYDLGAEQKGVKSEVLFLERCIRLLGPGGRLGIVVPDGVLNNPSLEHVRDYVEERARILGVVSIPDETFRSSKTAVKASLLFLQRLTAAKARERAKTARRELLRAQRDVRPRVSVLESVVNMTWRQYEIRRTRRAGSAGVQHIVEEVTRLVGKDHDSVEYRRAQGLARKSLKQIQEDLSRRVRHSVKSGHDYKVFMAVANRVGIRGSGKEDPENELPSILKEWREFLAQPERYRSDVRQQTFGIRLSELDRWDPTSFRPIEWRCAPDILRPLGSVLRARVEEVDRSKYEFGDLTPITIHFDGSIEARDTSDTDDYSMDLYFAHVGDIVVSKIDLKNGAVGIVPETLKNVIVTNHFVVYEPDRDRIYPPYLMRLIQSGFFRDYLWRKKVGSEGRKEVKIHLFEETRIPIPDLPDQRATVARWETLSKAKAEIEAKMETETAALETTLIEGGRMT
jgi:type I restriction enzyme M protein